MTGKQAPLASCRFEAEVIYWRGPSPYFFVALPSEHAETIRETARIVSYGWGMIPVDATIASVDFRTALFPKDGGYLLPLKDVVRKHADMSVGDRIEVHLHVSAMHR